LLRDVHKLVAKELAALWKIRSKASLSEENLIANRERLSAESGCGQGSIRVCMDANVLEVEAQS
jgi:hypothetical protein